ncbi:MAG: hypothetical protein GYA61_05965 [Spirochaetales bacterium]|nr:hypothetical protein [Spirochaetales bacterium]
MKNIKNKIKNIVRTSFTILILLIFVLTPILGEGTNVILVNWKQYISDLLKANSITVYNIDGAASDLYSYNIDDSYWASDFTNYSGNMLIKEKSKKMIDELYPKINNPFILLGFSQGGLRVRSMAQYIAERYPDLIASGKFKGFITLDSPNTGGYIAQKQNAKAVCNRVGWNLIASVDAYFTNSTFLDLILLTIQPMISILLSTEEQNDFENINVKLYEYAKESLKDKIDFEELENNFNAFSKSDEEKGVALLSGQGLKFLCDNILPQVEGAEWFGQILAGALELQSSPSYRGANPANVREITSEFRPGSAFLNDLNNPENIKKETGGSYTIKRASLIGKNGDIMNVDKANIIINQICSIHNVLAVTAIDSATKLWRKHQFFLGAYFYIKSIQNKKAKDLWSKFSSDFTYWVTNGGNSYNPEDHIDRSINKSDYNSSHDLLIPLSSQEIVGYRKYELDQNFYMTYINHIVPDSGKDILIPSQQEEAEEQLKSRLKDAYNFISDNNQHGNSQ